jgi:predicted metal-binding membrane protein
LVRTPELRVTALFLLGTAAIAWVVTADRMQGMDAGPGTDFGGLGWFSVVWATMMAAMMLPSLTPMAAASAAGQRGVGSTATATLFAAGYLSVWAAAGLLAYALVTGVRSLDLGFLAWDEAGPYVAGGVIFAAALYELTPLKARCLRHCRERELLRHRSGAAGAVSMGIEQGAFCFGSSWALMAALFALGVMSIGWMVLIAVLVAVEKLAPWVTHSKGAIAVLLAVLGIAVAFFPDQVPGLTIPMDTSSMPTGSMSM